MEDLDQGECHETTGADRTIFAPVPRSTGQEYSFVSTTDVFRSALKMFGSLSHSAGTLSSRSASAAVCPTREPTPFPLRIVIEPGQVTLGAKIRGTLLECRLATEGASDGLVEESSSADFIFDLTMLRRCFSCFGESPNRFTYQPNGRGERVANLRLQQGRTALNLATLPDGKFPGDATELTGLVEYAAFDPDLLVRGLAHARLFSARRRGESSPPPLIEIRNGLVIGANESGCAIFEAPNLAGLDIRIPTNTMHIFHRVLKQLDARNAHLLGCASHHVVRDGSKLCAWSKPSGRLTPIEDRLLAYRVGEQSQISRVVLRRHLQALKVVRTAARQPATSSFADVGRDLDFEDADHDGKAIQLRIVGHGKAAEMLMLIRDSTGRSRGRAGPFPCERLSGSKQLSPHPGQSLDVMVDLTAFLKVVEHFNGSNVTFGIALSRTDQSRYLIVEDTKSGVYHARSFLPVLPHLGGSKKSRAHSRSLREDTR